MASPKRVLIACERSGVVREAFRARGHDARSCDLAPAEDGSAFHIQGDAREAVHYGWDLIIAHPPCTYLLSAGARWKYDSRYPNRLSDQDKAIEFFMYMVNAPAEQVAVENPIGIMSTRYRKPDQIISPHQFGGEFIRKATCLWLKGLPPLIRKNYLIPEKLSETNKGIERKLETIHNLARTSDRGQIRSRTYPQVALAMADQWG